MQPHRLFGSPFLRKDGTTFPIDLGVSELALDAEVGQLVLFHHDPDRTDYELEAIRSESEDFFKGKRSDTRVLCAWEGLEIGK